MAQESNEPGKTPEELYSHIQSVLFGLGEYAVDFFRYGKTQELEALAGEIKKIKDIATIVLIPSPREPISEYSIQQKDGSAASIRLWDNCFEINGKIIANDEQSFIRETLELFIRHTGEKLTVKDAVIDPEFLPENSGPSRASAFHRYAKLFREWSGETGLFVIGSSPSPKDKKVIGWWGINVEPEPQSQPTPEPQSQPTPEPQPIPEPSIPLETPKKPIQEYVFQREGLINPDLPELETITEETSIPEEKRQPDLAKLQGLNLSTVEKETIDYIVGLGKIIVNLRDLVHDKPGIPVIIDDLRRVIVPSLQVKIKEKDLKIALEIKAVIIDNDACPHLYITAL